MHTYVIQKLPLTRKKPPQYESGPADSLPGEVEE